MAGVESVAYGPSIQDGCQQLQSFSRRFNLPLMEQVRQVREHRIQGRAIRGVLDLHSHFLRYRGD
ncbi:hypothetical protein [Hyalangium sp.]|uniref:hypothetical protein n=1 Tax=Hyalangium sp. TaxID=2028555 RepID=UPI002D582038|nr:hypothetical protein [Hyalangium sp.]HYH99627.1 hypothetical protein [Hyalangium sp.]